MTDELNAMEMADALYEAGYMARRGERDYDPRACPEWQVVVDKIDRLTEALQVARHFVYYGTFQLGWNIDRLDEVLSHNTKETES